MDVGNDPLLGKQLGVYQVQACLGQGGMARVYKAYHSHLRREVAIKVILAESANLASFQARFKLEAQMIASLDHPNIVRVYDFGEEGELAYLVMQYLSGGTLREQMRAHQPMDPLRATRYAIQMAQALHHAHQHGIIHRDVKPQNMLLSSSDPNQLLLSDFGIAKLYYQNNEAPLLTEMPTRNTLDPELSSASQIIGTADYMAPEQARGQAVDARTDVYALGVVLFQMLTGDKPFHAASVHGLLVQHVVTPAPWVSASNPQVSDALARITAKALAKNPGERFQSAEEMVYALEQANSNATNRLMAFPSQMAPMPTGNASAWTPPLAQHYTTVGMAPAWTSTPNTPPPFNPSVAIPTRSSEQARNSITMASQVQAIAAQATAPAAHAHPARRRFQWSYVLLALVVIVSLVALSLRIFPSATGSGGGSAGNSGSASPSGNGTAQAFHEQFQNNNLNWLVGTDTPGVTLGTPAEGAYTVTISTDTTAFPYPQAVGTLPTAFTLAATLQQTAGESDSAYGLAFHFAAEKGNISCYAFIIMGNGSYALDEYQGSVLHTITTGSTSASADPHTLKVQARGSSYSFFIDQQTIHLTIGSQSATSDWTNSDLHGGLFTLFFAGPNPGGKDNTFKATDVQLSIP